MSRQARVIEAMLALDGGIALIERLAVTAMRLSETSGCGMSVMADGRYQTTLCVSGKLGHIEELQFTLGEGPSISAHQTGELVSAPDLMTETRWPLFTRAAEGADAMSAFGFPLQVGAARIGALSLFGDQTGKLTTDQYADVLVVVDLAIISILTVRAGVPADPIGELTGDGSSQHWRVHQATGMVSVQLGVSIEEALLRLRAHAFAIGAPISEIAADIVTRRFRFEPAAP